MARAPLVALRFSIVFGLTQGDVDMPVDNLSVDKDGVIWAAGGYATVCSLMESAEWVRLIPGLTKVTDLVYQHFSDPSIPAASTAIRITLNIGSRSAFFGEKYKIDHVCLYFTMYVACEG